MIASSASTMGTSAATTAPKTRISTMNAGGIAKSSVSRSSNARSLNVWLKLPKPKVATVNPPSPSRSSIAAMIVGR